MTDPELSTAMERAAGAERAENGAVGDVCAKHRGGGPREISSGCSRRVILFGQLTLIERLGSPPDRWPENFRFAPCA